MKKHLLALTAIAGLACASLAFSADALPNNGYSTSKHMSKATAAAKSLAARVQPHTDITVQNRGYGYITMHVDRTSIFDSIDYNDEDHVYNDAPLYTRIMISNPYGQTIFDQTVCPRSIIKVYSNQVIKDDILC